MSDILIKRNHTLLNPWHNYVSTRNSQPITINCSFSFRKKASLITLDRTGMMLLSMWDRCLAGTEFHEYIVRSTWYHLFRRYRTDVYKLHLL